MGGSSGGGISGYKYAFGLHMAFCHGPIDVFRELIVSDKVAWPSANAAEDIPPVVMSYEEVNQSGGWFDSVEYNGRPPAVEIPQPPVVTGPVTASHLIYVNAPNLFGGDEREGGIAGFVDIHFGGPNEPADEYLMEQLGEKIPAFRGVFHMVARQVYVAAMNPYIKPWAAYATRIFAQSDGGTQWYPEKAKIGEFDMNPMHMIRECLTNKIYGRGRDGLSDIDDVSFRYAADVLFDESFGLSTLWGDTRDIDAFVQNICTHVDGSLFQDRVTNRWKFKLARNDYVIEDLLVIDEDSILEIDELGRPLPSELTNQVTLTYWNRATRKNDTIVLDNSALQDSIGGQINPNDLDRTCICETGLAKRVASRELRSLSTSLLTGRISVNRIGIQLSMGDTFRLRLPTKNITEAVVRVTDIDFGTKDAEQIILSFIEDIFALPATTYLGTGGGTLWQDPRKPPLPSLHRYAGEAPFWSLMQLVGPQTYATLPEDSGAFVAAGTRQSTSTYSLNAWTRQGSASYEDRGSFPACAVAFTVGAAIREESSAVFVTGVIDKKEIYYNKYAVWDDELVLVLDYNYRTGLLLLARGVLDTVPVPHLAGSRILFVDNHQLVDTIQYDIGETVESKLVTRTVMGELRLSDAPSDTYTFNARHTRPYPPGKFRVNDLYYPPLVYGETVLSWSTRNRLQQTAYIVQQSEGNIATEPGVTYTVRVKDADGVVVGTHTGIEGSVWPYPVDLDVGDGALQDITFEVYGQRGLYTSWQYHTHSMVRHGLGFHLGTELGGVIA